MAIAGGAHAMMAILVGPIFDRVLNPHSPNAPLELFRVPFTGDPFYLQQLAPPGVSNVWTIVAVAILAVFLLKGWPIISATTW
jgi:hypothetical protein